MRSNQGTLIHQKPLVVKAGQVVEAGDVLADGSATDKGEMALGKNLQASPSCPGRATTSRTRSSCPSAS